MNETNISASARMKAVSRLVAMLEAMEPVDRAWAMRSLNDLFPQPVVSTPVGPATVVSSGAHFAER